MISPRQVKAARALLGWSQADLAKKVGLHLNAINNIERGGVVPRQSTLQKIKTACEMGGVRFRGQRGVEVRDEAFEVYRFEGREFIRRLAQDIIAVVQSPEEEVLNLVLDEQMFNLADKKENERYYQHMKKIGFKERILTSKKYENFINPNRQVYRWLPEKTLGTIAYNIYGDRVGFIYWQTREILSIRSMTLANSFRAQYNLLWEQAEPFSAWTLKDPD